MREAKTLHIFSTKNIGIFQILMFEIVTKHLLTLLLVLNNWAQSCKLDQNFEIVLEMEKKI